MKRGACRAHAPKDSFQTDLPAKFRGLSPTSQARSLHTALHKRLKIQPSCSPKVCTEQTLAILDNLTGAPGHPQLAPHRPTRASQIGRRSVWLHVAGRGEGRLARRVPRPCRINACPAARNIKGGLGLSCMPREARRGDIICAPDLSIALVKPDHLGLFLQYTVSQRSAP